MSGCEFIRTQCACSFNLRLIARVFLFSDSSTSIKNVAQRRTLFCTGDNIE